MAVEDNGSRIQFEAAGGQTFFTYPFEIFKATDLKVFLTPVGQIPDPVADILVLNVDYTVTGVGNDNGGDVILNTPATAFDIITIERDVAIERLTDFTGGDFTPDTINQQLDRITVIEQQIDNLISVRGLTYEVTSELSSTGGDNDLPVLAPNTGSGIPLWSKNSSGNLEAILLDENIDASALRTELANQGSGTDGARLVGYFDDADLTGKTVKAKLDEIHDQSFRKNFLIGGNFYTNPWQRGTSFVSVPDFSYTADRMRWNQTGTMVVDIDKVADAPPVASTDAFALNSFRVECTTNQALLGPTDAADFRQVLEGFNWSYLFQRTFTLSFWVKSNITGIFSVGFANADPIDRVYVSEYTIIAPNTWEYKTITVSPSPSAGNWNTISGQGLQVIWNLAAGVDLQTSTLDTWNSNSRIASTNQVNWTGAALNQFSVNFLQIESGDTATAFEAQRIDEIIEDCQRYYEKSYPIGTAPGTAMQDNQLRVVQGTTDSVIHGIQEPFNTRKRIKPNVFWYSPNTGLIGNVRNEGGTVDIAVNAASSFRGDYNTGDPVQTVGSTPAGTVVTAQFAAEAEL